MKRLDFAVTATGVIWVCVTALVATYLFATFGVDAIFDRWAR
jgi:hypothetical protein